MENEKNTTKGQFEISDVSELASLLDTVAEKVPNLVKSLIGTLYSAESGRNMGQAIGGLYKELIESGIPEDVALDMAKSYMISLKDITKVVNDKE